MLQSLAAENWKERRPKEELALGARLVDDLELVDLATSMKRWPANDSVQVAVVGNIWGFGDKTDGTVIDCIQFVE